MITLDEVIKAIEECRDSYVAGKIIKSDALYYLKMYRSDMQMYSENQKYWEDELKQKIKDFGDAKERYIKRLKELEIGTLNPPLTWDELKAMTGKPVWVEYGIGFNQKRWVVIHSFHNTGFCYMNVSGNYPNTFWQKDMGEDEFWQAYRKERNM